MSVVREQARVAREVVEGLGAALRGVGVTLPSLGLDPVSCASGYMPPLVDLGRCNVETARQLTRVLEGYARAAGSGPARL